jgi:hypothetical protein
MSTRESHDFSRGRDVNHLSRGSPDFKWVDADEVEENRQQCRHRAELTHRQSGTGIDRPRSFGRWRPETLGDSTNADIERNERSVGGGPGARVQKNGGTQGAAPA